MLKKLSNKLLLILLIFLVAIILLIKYFDLSKERVEKSLDRTQVNIDTARHTAIYVSPNFSDEEELPDLFLEEKSFEQLLNITEDEWIQLKYSLPIFGDYTLAYNEGNWFIDDLLVNQERVTEYFKSLEVINENLEKVPPFNYQNQYDFQLLLFSETSVDTIRAIAFKDSVVIYTPSVDNRVNNTFSVFEKVFVGKMYWFGK